jgi:rubrerythrin
MAKEKSISEFDIIQTEKLDPNTDVIKFEGDNSVFFRRVSGDFVNPLLQISVPETHRVIYIKNGQMQEVLDAGLYPVFQVQKGLFGHIKKVDAVTLDIIFISKTCKVKVLWGTREPIRSRDPLTQIPVTIRSNGEFTIQIDNPKKFYLEIVGADKVFNIESLKERLAARMLSFVEPVIAKYMHDKQMSYVDVSAEKKNIQDTILPEVDKMFVEEDGLKCSSFTIYSISIDDAQMEAIEDKLAQERDELKEKKDAKEIAAEVERLGDKEWERSLLLKNLEQADRDKYYEVLKVLGWPDANGAGKSGGHFCPKCGHSYEQGMKFCPGCGNPLPGGKTVCPKCGKENPSDAAFCFNCGTKLN